MEVNFKSFYDSQMELESIIKRIDREIESTEAVVSKLNELTEINHEKKRLKQSLCSLSQSNNDLRILTNALSKISYRYASCERKVMSIKPKFSSELYKPQSFLNKTNFRVDSFIKTWNFKFSLK